MADIGNNQTAFFQPLRQCPVNKGDSTLFSSAEKFEISTAKCRFIEKPAESHFICRNMPLINLLDSLQNHIIAMIKQRFAHINMPEQIFCLLVNSLTCPRSFKMIT